MSRVPRLAVLAVLSHEGRVLLVQRRNAPDAGLWGYPGGHVDWGETVAEAALRELREETGVTAEAAGWLANLDTIVRDEAGDVAHHFLLVAIRCRYLEGDPRAADDVSAAEWVPAAEILARARPMSRDVDRVLRLALGHDRP